MKMYTCPYCGEESISRLKKAFAGNLKSKGTKCPDCGKRCTNGKESTIFNAILYFVAFIIMLILLFAPPFNATIAFIIAIFTIPFCYIINRFFDAFFYELSKSMRKD